MRRTAAAAAAALALTTGCATIPPPQDINGRCYNIKADSRNIDVNNVAGCQLERNEINCYRVPEGTTHRIELERSHYRTHPFIIETNCNDSE